MADQTQDKRSVLLAEIDPLIAECRSATKAYRDAYALASRLKTTLAAQGVCATCAISEHFNCGDYGCTCCGGGK